MSLSTTTYIGYYITIKHKTYEILKKENRCRNNDCSSKKKILTNFCPKCGTKITQIDIPTTITLSPFKILDERGFYGLREVESYDKKNHILISNSSDSSLYLHEYDSGVYDMPENDIEKFKQDHMKELSVLIENYGDNLTIKFGIVVYES